MPTELKNAIPNSVEHSTTVDAYRTGLAADMESLLAIFDGIEQMVVADGHANTLSPSFRSRSIRALAH